LAMSMLLILRPLSLTLCGLLTDHPER